MRVVTAAEIDAALSFPTLVDALAEAFRTDVVTPPRHHHTVTRDGADATLLLMPAWTGAVLGGAVAGQSSRVGVADLDQGCAGHLYRQLSGHALTDGTVACAHSMPRVSAPLRC